MEQLLHPSAFNRPLILPYSSSFTRKFSFKTRKRRNLSEFHRNSFNFSFSATNNVHVSARFGGPTNRRNSLRKKLIDDQQVRQNNPISINPSSDFQSLNPYKDINHSSLENSDDNILKEGTSSLAFDSSRITSKTVGESAMSSKLEKWIDQYNKDVAYWGVGSGQIFTVFHDSQGNVKRVLVDEREILKRIPVGKLESGDKSEVNSKILYAKSLANEMERGENVIPKNSSVAKFVVSSEEGFVNSVRSAVLRPNFIPVVMGYGKIALFGFVAIWALRKLISFGSKEEQLTELEKEMMRRKIKSRKEKEMLMKDGVEVVQKASELPTVPTEKPKLDKQELMRNILETKAAKDKLLLESSSTSQTAINVDFDEKIQKIRAMAGEAREIEYREQPVVSNDREGKQPVNEALSGKMGMVEEHTGEAENFSLDITNGEPCQGRDMNDTQGVMSIDEPKGDDIEYLREKSFERDKVTCSSESSGLEVSNDMETMASGEVKDSFEKLDQELHMPNDRSSAVKPRIIRSVKEAREFLAKKGNKRVQESQADTIEESTIHSSHHGDKASVGKLSQRKKIERQITEPVTLGRTSDSSPATNIREDLIPEVKELFSTNKDYLSNSQEGNEMQDFQNSQTLVNGDVFGGTEKRQPVETENWMEKNYHEVEPIIKKIGEGIRDNYNLARENRNQFTGIDIRNLNYNANDDGELEWMKDDDLRDIVFQVRENELSGRDPFHLMNAEDKHKFFEGLEKKVEKENEKLLKVHEFLHSNIENLDYGADGISLYDQPEKFIPRWKGPPLEKRSEFLNNFQNQQTGLAGTADTSYMRKDEPNMIQKSTESQVIDDTASSLLDNALEKSLHDKDAKNSKTIIEGSDGSIRAGKKSGKEFWQHTKKWSRGFLESYNAETDPEIKSVMKDMGKDLDRWITEDDIQEAADLMEKLPERNKKFIEKKMNKLKREMELFGPQAVVSKYREYAEQKEEDYLWWLDLPHILCIELYTVQDGEQKVGFYSLEMAADLELEPKPCHVIAFEDAGDCKNFCCIIQAHMDMLGNGRAFVVPRPPKDAFRYAKASGFGVTVIRKKELKLNVDQTLEEVEEQITEIGSKMYHDQLMRERSLDISSLTKGVFGFKDRPATASGRARRKRSKQTLKKPSRKK